MADAMICDGCKDVGSADDMVVIGLSDPKLRTTYWADICIDCYGVIEAAVPNVVNVIEAKREACKRGD